jgi:hypothetical protein
MGCLEFFQLVQLELHSFDIILGYKVMGGPYVQKT